MLENLNKNHHLVSPAMTRGVNEDSTIKFPRGNSPMLRKKNGDRALG